MTVRIQWPRRTGLLRELSKTSLSYFYWIKYSFTKYSKEFEGEVCISCFFFYFGRKVILRLHNKLLRKHAEGVLKKNYDWH